MSNPSLKRNELGLLEGIEYKFKENGSIDWRAMINPKHLVINKQYEASLTKKFGMPLNEIPVTEVEDNKLLILLQGIKDVAFLRGYTSVRPKLVFATEYKAAAECSIQWIPNFETGGLPFEFGDVGSASLDSTSGFGKMYLESIAFNRAFVRAVRNSLGISILGSDEIDQKATENFLQKDKGDKNPFGPHAVLENNLQKRGINLKDLVAKIVAEKAQEKLSSDASQWKVVEDIPVKDVSFLLSLVNK